MKAITASILALFCIAPLAYSDILPSHIIEKYGEAEWSSMTFKTPDFSLQCYWQYGHLVQASATPINELTDDIVDSLLALFGEGSTWSHDSSGMETWTRGDGQFNATRLPDYTHNRSPLIISASSNNPTYKMIKQKHVEQGGPGYPPHGVGSPDP